MCCGSVVSQRWWRIGGSLIFGVVAVYVLFGALSSLVPPVDETSKTVMAALDGSHAAVVTMGFACALVDTLVARTKGAKPHKKK